MVLVRRPSSALPVRPEPDSGASRGESSAGRKGVRRPPGTHHFESWLKPQTVALTVGRGQRSSKIALAGTPSASAISKSRS